MAYKEPAEITIENLKYNNHVFILAYVDPNGDRKDYTNNGIFIDEEGPDNYGVTTWACSEAKWKEYLYNGNFDSVEVGGYTVGTPYEHYIEVITSMFTQDAKDYIAEMAPIFRKAIESGKIEYSLYRDLLSEYPGFEKIVGKSNLRDVEKGYKEEYKDSDTKEMKTIYHIGSMAYSVSQYFQMGSTDVQVRSSGYARFADTEIPKDVLNGTESVTFTGILTEYKGAAQFTLIDLEGVKKSDGTPWYN